ncbi:MAG: transposase [Pseudonocardiaceae bacterium]
MVFTKRSITQGKDTYLVGRIVGGERSGQRVRIGPPDESLTAVSGMVAVSELCGRLGVVEALDTAVGSIKQRARGRSAGALLVGLAAAQLAGEDHLVGLDRQCAEGAGQALVPVAGLGSTTAAGLGRRVSPQQWAAVETGVHAVTARMLARLSAARREALLRSVTIDLDTTDVEVYGRKKRGVAYNYQGQRCGRPHVASWAELQVTLAADLLAGDQDPRPGAPGLLRRALRGLPAGVGEVKLRADGGYFAVDLAVAAHREGVGFAIGATRIAPVWKALAGISESDWTDATCLPGGGVELDGEPAGSVWPQGQRMMR